MNLKTWFKDDLEIKRGKTIDTYGNPVFTETIQVKGKKEDKIKIIKNITGNEIVSTAVVFLLPNVEINIGDYIGNLEVVFITLKKDYKNRPLFWEVYL